MDAVLVIEDGEKKKKGGKYMQITTTLELQSLQNLWL